MMLDYFVADHEGKSSIHLSEMPVYVRVDCFRICLNRPDEWRAGKTGTRSQRATGFG